MKLMASHFFTSGSSSSISFFPSANIFVYSFCVDIFWCSLPRRYALISVTENKLLVNGLWADEWCGWQCQCCCRCCCVARGSMRNLQFQFNVIYNEFQCVKIVRIPRLESHAERLPISMRYQLVLAYSIHCFVFALVSASASALGIFFRSLHLCRCKHNCRCLFATFKLINLLLGPEWNQPTADTFGDTKHTLISIWDVIREKKMENTARKRDREKRREDDFFLCWEMGRRKRRTRNIEQGKVVVRTLLRQSSWC